MPQASLIQEVKREIKVVHFGGEDLIPNSDWLKDLKTIVEESEDLYPGIDLWFKRSVAPELVRRSARSALLFYDGDNPVAGTVIRRGIKSTKICNMRALPEYQKMGFGKLIMNLILAEIRHDHTKNIHFTIPAQMWEGDVGDFFRRYGFKFKEEAKTQYRQMDLFNPELACAAPYKVVWQKLIEMLAESMENFELEGKFGDLDLMLSLHPKLAKLITDGEKRVEIRRRFNNKWEGARMLLYAAAPERCFVGEATVIKVIADTPQNIWSVWKDEVGCSSEEFFGYCRGRSQVYALVLGDVKRYKSPIFKSQLEVHTRSTLKTPQSYLAIKSNEEWSKAIRVGRLLSANR